MLYSLACPNSMLLTGMTLPTWLDPFPNLCSKKKNNAAYDYFRSQQGKGGEILLLDDTIGSGDDTQETV